MYNNKLAPLVITVYSRFNHFKKCINSLSKCPEASETVLYVGSDAFAKEEDRKDIEKIRDYVQTISCFKKIVEVFHSVNIGATQNYEITFAKVFEKHDKFIFLEDDVLVAPDFLQFMNEGLDIYKYNKRIFSISAFSHSIFLDFPSTKKNDTYFTQRFNPWGFAIWKDKYLLKDKLSLGDIQKIFKSTWFKHSLDSVGIDRWPQIYRILKHNITIPYDYKTGIYMLMNNMYSVVPYATKSFNIGNDGSGERSANNKRFNIDLSFLNFTNEYIFHESIDGHIDNSFHYRFFNTPFHRFKRLLSFLGINDLAYRFKPFLKGR